MPALQGGVKHYGGEIASTLFKPKEAFEMKHMIQHEPP